MGGGSSRCSAKHVPHPASVGGIDGSGALHHCPFVNDRPPILYGRIVAYRRLHVLLRREGHAVNRKRVQRIYREERLTVRRRGGRKRAMGTRRPLETPLVANQRWSLDFVSDQMTDGRRFRILTVIDNCTRECLALVADTSLSGARVVRELDAVIRQRGRPDTIVSDNGTEYTSNSDQTGVVDRLRRVRAVGVHDRTIFLSGEWGNRSSGGPDFTCSLQVVLRPGQCRPVQFRRTLQTLQATAPRPRSAASRR